MAECRYCGAEVKVGYMCAYCGRVAEPMYYPDYKPVKKEKTKEERKPPNKIMRGTYYTVQKGDCLWNIAKRAYGNGALFNHILIHNKNFIKDPDRIYVGQVIFIPPYKG